MTSDPPSAAEATALAPTQDLTHAVENTVAEEIPQEVKELMSAAASHDYSMLARSELRRLFARTLGQRMRNRQKGFQHQVMAYNIPRVPEVESLAAAALELRLGLDQLATHV